MRAEGVAKVPVFRLRTPGSRFPVRFLLLLRRFGWPGSSRNHCSIRRIGIGNRESETGNPCGPALTPFATPSSCTSTSVGLAPNVVAEASSLRPLQTLGGLRRGGPGYWGACDAAVPGIGGPATRPSRLLGGLRWSPTAKAVGYSRTWATLGLMPGCAWGRTTSWLGVTGHKPQWSPTPAVAHSVSCGGALRWHRTSTSVGLAPNVDVGRAGTERRRRPGWQVSKLEHRRCPCSGQASRLRSLKGVVRPRTFTTPSSRLRSHPSPLTPYPNPRSSHTSSPAA
jgi:hypothetical protein